MDKTAATLATSFEKLVLTWIKEFIPSQPQAALGSRTAKCWEIWMAHAMIGDAIPTNEAAAKILWALAVTGAFKQVRYFLLLGKCGTHQTALTAKNGVCAEPGKARK